VTTKGPARGAAGQHNVTEVVLNQEIVEALAATNPIGVNEVCTLCDADEPMTWVDHAPECPWRRAREAVR
jgi:hypothetical protein